MGIGKGTEMGKKVLITASHYEELCGEAKALFERNGYELVINQKDMPYYTFEELSQLVTDVDGVVLGLDEWNEAVVKIAPRLKVLAKFGVGVDNIDLEKAKEYGIKVLNARGKNANAVAELAVAFILNAMRQIPWLDGELKEGSWHRFVGRELAGKTVGLLGFGDIARRVAKKLSGFDVRLIACDKYPDEEAAKRLNVTMVSQEELLGESDVVSIHVPNTPDNHHLMDRDAFAMMKQGAYFINTARGGLMDTEALCDAVESGHLAGAATDVYEYEPLKRGDRILSIPSIITTPHTGAETSEVYRAVSLSTAKGVMDVLEGREPENWVNRW